MKKLKGMADKPLNSDSIFWVAVEIHDPEQRDKYLDEACGDDAALREQLADLLAAYPKVDQFLEEPAANLVASIDVPVVAENPGTQIGPYTIREKLGEGGMGVVYVAEQKKPVRRKVALKIVKPGMDTKQVLARFEAERMTLAMMDHPHIAKVLDAGATATGRSYFVMELVHTARMHLRNRPLAHYHPSHRV